MIVRERLETFERDRKTARPAEDVARRAPFAAADWYERARAASGGCESTIVRASGIVAVTSNAGRQRLLLLDPATGAFQRPRCGTSARHYPGNAGA